MIPPSGVAARKQRTIARIAGGSADSFTRAVGLAVADELTASVMVVGLASSSSSFVVRRSRRRDVKRNGDLRCSP